MDSGGRIVITSKPGNTTRRPGPIGGHHQFGNRGTSVVVRGQRVTVSDVEARAARRIADLIHIMRVYQRVVEQNFERLNAPARLAAVDARRRLAEFLEREDVE
jgi:hypothetical protein